MQGIIVNVRSNSKTQFTDALVQNAEERENLTPVAALSAGLTCRSVLRTITILSLQNLSYEVNLWKSANFAVDSDLDTNSFIGKWLFTAGDGTQIAGTGTYYYYIDGLFQPYHDTDTQGQIHVSLINRDTTAKVAGSNRFAMILGFEPTI